jgi:membrane fusion protein
VPATPSNVRLFRSEVLIARETRWLGTVLLAPRVSHRLFALFAALAAAAVLALLFFGAFTRKAHIDGWLVPQAGLARAFAPRAGVVTGLHVAEGDQVRQGDRLLTISAELESAALGGTQAEISRRLVERRQSLVAEQDQRQQLLERQQRAVAERVGALGAELEQIEHEIALLTSRVELADRTAERHRELREQGFISEVLLQQVEADRLEQSTRLSALERTSLGLERDRQAAESELAELPLKVQRELAVLQREIATLEQELAEAEAQREFVVSAPQDGTVTAILAELGGHAEVAKPLLSIVPSGTKLEAHLYGPSRAIGFVRPGQQVSLRYAAYPYQKFGHYEAVVTSVSRSPVSLEELPPQLTGVTAAASEPVYRITASLATQSATVYGEQVPLQTGMRLDADVALETRRIFEWVLDPLYTLTGK